MRTIRFRNAVPASAVPESRRRAPDSSREGIAHFRARARFAARMTPPPRIVDTPPMPPLSQPRHLPFVPLGVLALWTFRLLMLWSRGAQRDVPQLAIGLLFDLCLVAGAFLLVHAFARASRPLASLAGALLVTASVWARTVDLAHCFLARSHFVADSFLYLEGGFAGRLLAPRALALLFTALVGNVAGIWLLVRRLRESPPSRWSAPVGALLLAMPIAASQVQPADAYSLRLVPELNLASQLRAYLGATNPRPPVHVPPDRWQRWVRAGLVRADTQPNAAFPLYRTQFDPQPLPMFPSASQRPNIVLTLLESTNRVFVHALSGQFPGLMPELGALTERMTSVDGYWNLTSPTFSGLLATLCSILPPGSTADLQRLGRQPGWAGPSCLADVLQRAGYRTLFVQGADARALDLETFLRRHGFADVRGDTAIQARFPDAEKSEMGYHDQEVLRYAAEQVERLEALRRVDGRPYFLLVMTLDAHEPGLAGPACTLPKNPDGSLALLGLPDSGNAQRALAGYYCEDRAVGELARFLLQPERARNLLWALTADHATFRTLGNESILPNTPQDWAFDELPLLLHPRHDAPSPPTPRVSGQLDVAPTLLHLLGLSTARTTFMGRSLFGAPLPGRWLVGRVGMLRAFMHDGTAPLDLSLGELAERCARHQPLQSRGLDACDVQQFLQWQDGLWAGDRFVPAWGAR